jgi:glycosyltransferase involved in cell wall biosynthesis
MISLNYFPAAVTRQQMIAAGIPEATLDALAPQLVIHGRVPRSDVLALLKETDFTLLMRSAQQRYAKAGFPTKVVESLSGSTPVICNLTSDLADYLTDGKDALIVAECSAQALQTQLEKAIQMSKTQRQAMCAQAAQTAEERFLYTRFAVQMEQILQ